MAENPDLLIATPGNGVGGTSASGTTRTEETVLMPAMSEKRTQLANGCLVAPTWHTADKEMYLIAGSRLRERKLTKVRVVQLTPEISPR